MEHLGDPGAVLIVDDTGFLKKGTRSAGVQRQYSGTAGRTENCQIGVFLAYATGRGRTLIDRRLYLPASWADDRERCRQAGIDDSVAFATKVAMAKVMVRKAIADRVPSGWVTADAAYGYSEGWRFELEQADVFHAMATTRHDTVVTRWALDHPAHDLFPGLPRQKWKRRSCGEGANGQRIFDWARVEVRPWRSSRTLPVVTAWKKKVKVAGLSRSRRSGTIRSMRGQSPSTGAGPPPMRWCSATRERVARNWL